MIWSYIGDLGDPTFVWDNPSDAARAGNLPRRIVPSHNFQSLGVGVHWVIEAIEEGRYDGEQLDWGAWGLKMTGDEIRTLLPNDTEILAPLDPETHYVLVVYEDA